MLAPALHLSNVIYVLAASNVTFPLKSNVNWYFMSVT